MNIHVKNTWKAKSWDLKWCHEISVNGCQIINEVRAISQVFIRIISLIFFFNICTLTAFFLLSSLKRCMKAQKHFTRLKTLHTVCLQPFQFEDVLFFLCNLLTKTKIIWFWSSFQTNEINDNVTLSIKKPGYVFSHIFLTLQSQKNIGRIINN